MNGRRSLRLEAERWPLAVPFRIAGLISTDAETLTITLEEGGRQGRGEASGIYFQGETVESMAAEVEAVRHHIEGGIDRAALLRLLPAGGARNAVDCATWALEARCAGRPAWDLAGLPPPRPIKTAFSIGASTPAAMAAIAASRSDFGALKLKLVGDGDDVARVAAVRRCRSDAWIGVDANQGLDRSRLQTLLPHLVEQRVAMIEQPVPIGADDSLEGLDCPIPLFADESLTAGADLQSLRRVYDGINIKLDKTGGLTAALALAHSARELGFELMVGNMLGTSLAMAPAWLLGQQCTIVDLDGPLLLARDRAQAATYVDGCIACPPEVWA